MRLAWLRKSDIRALDSPAGILVRAVGDGDGRGDGEGGGGGLGVSPGGPSERALRLLRVRTMTGCYSGNKSGAELYHGIRMVTRMVRAVRGPITCEKID